MVFSYDSKNNGKFLTVKELQNLIKSHNFSKDSRIKINFINKLNQILFLIDGKNH